MYTKTEAMREIFDIEQVTNRWPSNKVSKEKLLEVISRPSYNLKNDLGVCANTVVRILRKLWPDKPSTSMKICTYLLNKYELKVCPSCGQVLSLSCFHRNRVKVNGIGEYCVPCFNGIARDTRREYEATRSARKLDRTPTWSNLSRIKEIYKNCPKGYHVDHIIPLQGELVSGLHVEYNLQYLTAEDNLKKSNKFIPG